MASSLPPHGSQKKCGVRQPDRVEAVADEVADVLVDAVLPELVDATVSLKAGPVGPLEAQLARRPSLRLYPQLLTVR